MCVNCGTSSCSSCNQTPYSPSNSSALKYDGQKFVCPSSFTINPGDTLNSVLNTLMSKACENGNSSGILKRVSVPISSAEILTLNSAGVSKILLPSDPALAYDIHSVVLKWIPNTTDYTYVGANPLTAWVTQLYDPSNIPLGAQTLYSSTKQISENLNSFIAASAISVSEKMIQFIPSGLKVLIANAGLHLVVDGSMTLGNHSLVAYVTYVEVPVV